MSTGEELLAIGDRIVALAKPGEQVEVVVGRSTGTEVRVYEGQVEQLATATSAGIGVRVISDHRQGFAYAGSLDEDVLADTLAEARDNATFGTPDEWLGLAEPDDVAIPELDLYREELVKVATEAKIDLAVEGPGRRARLVALSPAGEAWLNRLAGQLRDLPVWGPEEVTPGPG